MIIPSLIMPIICKRLNGGSFAVKDTTIAIYTVKETLTSFNYVIMEAHSFPEDYLSQNSSLFKVRYLIIYWVVFFLVGEIGYSKRKKKATKLHISKP